MKWNDPGRDAFLKMEEAASEQKRAFQGKSGAEERKPWRDRLSGGLKGKMTVRTMDIIIGATIALIVLVIIIGVVS